MVFDIEKFWEAILSGEVEQVREAYLSLPDADERQAVYDHLTRMITEEGWADVQRESAQTALNILKTLT